MQWYLKVLRNYFNFEGRARRKELWYFVLFNFLASAALGIVDWIFGTSGENGGGLFQGLYGLAILLPALGVGARRLHDTGRSGWWLLIAFIPLIGALVLIYFWVLEGDKGDNEYGPDPLLEPEPGPDGRPV